MDIYQGELKHVEDMKKKQEDCEFGVYKIICSCVFTSLGKINTY